MNPPAALTWRVRRMTIDDLEEVLAIDQVSFSVPWSERSYRFELLDNPVATLFVAESNQPEEPRVLGYVGLWELVGEGHISTLAVEPAARRQGIAGSLIAKSLRFFASKGIETVSLEVRRSNEAAQALYSKFGFEKAGVRPGYYRDNEEDALIMSLDQISLAGLGLEVDGGTTG